MAQKRPVFRENIVPTGTFWEILPTNALWLIHFVKPSVKTQPPPNYLSVAGVEPRDDDRDIPNMTLLPTRSRAQLMPSVMRPAPTRSGPAKFSRPWQTLVLTDTVASTTRVACWWLVIWVRGERVGIRAAWPPGSCHRWTALGDQLADDSFQDTPTSR